MKYPYTKNSTIDVHLSNIQAAGLSIAISYTYKVYNQREEFQHREFILLSVLRLADLLQLKLFENNQVLINASTTASSFNEDDMNHQLERFFTEFDAHVTKVK